MRKIKSLIQWLLTGCGIRGDHYSREAAIRGLTAPRYDDRMDPECIALCDAINSIPGLKTVESCCGHGERPFKMWFRCDSLEHLPVLLYHCDPCHVGFRWWCKVKTDCAMSPVTFYIESESVGEAAYTEANTIAAKIMGLA